MAVTREGSLRNVVRVFLAVIAIISITGMVWAQATTPLSERPFVELQRTVQRRVATPGQELRIRWVAYPDAPSVLIPAQTREPDSKFEVLSQRNLSEPLTRERNPQLSTDQLVVVAVDVNAREIDWELVKDPRIVRAEVPRDDNSLTGTILHRPDTEFLLALPAGLRISELRIYQPDWNGTQFILRPIGVSRLPVSQ